MMLSLPMRPSEQFRWALLLISNFGPSLLVVLGASWLLVALLYCAGNGLWIATVEQHPPEETGSPHRLARWWAPCLLMTLGAIGWAWLGQSTTTVNRGLGFDGEQYLSMYSYFSTGKFAPVFPHFPYSVRIGFPFVAAQLPLGPRESFLFLHGTFWSASMLLFVSCCRLCFRLTWGAILAAVLWLQIAWFSIPRATANYNFTVDSAALFFMQAWIFLLLSDRARWLLPACAFLGVLFKETILLVVLLSLLALVGIRTIPQLRRIATAGVPDRADSLSRAMNPAVVAAVAAVVAKRLAEAVLAHTGAVGNTEWDTIWRWVSLRVFDPFALLRYLAAMFVAYGGFSLLWVATLGRPFRKSQERGWEVAFLTLLCLLYLGVCFVSGSDLTRFAFMGFPFMLPLLLIRFDDAQRAVGAFALLLGLPAAHAFTPIPEPLQPLPSDDLQGVYSWMMEYAHPTIVGSWLAWAIASILVLRVVTAMSGGRIGNNLS